MAQLFFAPYLDDSYILTKKEYTTNLIVEKGYSGKHPA
jgi:hypothetical protein